MIGNNEQKEFGDYQTPSYFTDIVCRYLRKRMNLSPNFIIEPTCGRGNFIDSCLKYFPNSKICGIEINKEYFNETKTNLNSGNVFIYNEDIFSFDFNHMIDTLSCDDKTLLVGNPPWVTNSELSLMKSEFAK
ncbi:MAG: N-6 DNA methylase [Methanobrevibacter sp.]|jgi:16S rRNA A1518/A1519 N6-dimethyltransferase RsmA/KsgA/DIM1 with predicted DNA glycosylase/AP lyase activity|nr:N-6 DNA methylase [Candidatus Methanovirga aequatorialis]